MRRLLLTCLCLALLASVAHADALLQMKLVTSQRFLTRLHYLMYPYAQGVFAEALGTLCHSDRIILARQYMDASSPSQTTERMAIAVSHNNVGDSVILDTVVDTTDCTDPAVLTTCNVPTGSSAPNDIDSSASDLAISNAVEDHWNTVSKCQQGL